MPTIAEQLTELVEQKEALADNLTSKGVASSHSEKLNTLVPKVLQIEGGGIDTSDATATANDLVSGKTAYARGVKITGAGNVMDTTEPISTTASASNVQQGMSAYVNGQRIVGECVSMSGTEITPTTSDQIITGPKILQGNKTMTIKGDSDLVAENIKKDVEIFGITGTYVGSGIDTSDATVVASDMKSGVVAYGANGKVIGNAYTRTSQVNAVADGLVDGTHHWLQAGFYNGIDFEAMPTLKAENIRNGVTIYGITGNYSPSIITNNLLDCYSKTSTADILADYGNGEIEVSWDGNFATWEVLNVAGNDHHIGAVIFNYSATSLGGITYEGYDNNANKTIMFTTPIDMAAHSIIKYRYYVSAWISPQAQLKFVSASSISEAKAKLANNEVAYSENIPCGNNLNEQWCLKEIESLTPDSYYIFWVQPNDPNGNEAILTDLQIIQL